jgi:methylated-DNA-[protein]-cysteine S-methyltransferase
MKAMTEHDRDPSIEAALGALGDPSPETWELIVAALSERAEAEGLLDVAVERHDSPLGTLLLGATSEGVVRVALPIEDEDAVLDELAARISPRVLRGARAPLTDARHQLDEYFDRRRHTFQVPLDWRLSSGFRREVLRATAQIPYGATASYRDVATSAGRPLAVRAAGTALARNPIPIVVPCHRVLRAGGQLGSYRGGADAKAQLLTLEGALAP